MAVSTCKICEWERITHIIFCNNCGISCCKLCQTKHERSCEAIKVNKYYMCKQHDCQVHGYCCECFETICEKCLENNHKGHFRVSMKDAWGNIRSNIHEAVNEMETKSIRFGEECSKTKKELASVLVVIKEEETKYKTFIDDIVNSLTSQVNANMQLIESKFKSCKVFVQNLNENKNRLTDLQTEMFELVCLSKYSKIMRQLFETEKQDIKIRILPPTIEVQNIRNQIRTLILNYEGSPVDESQNDENDGVDELAKAISNITLNETGRNKQYSSESELKSNGHLLVEEIEFLHRDNQHLKEKTNDMAEDLARLQSEKAFMKDMMTSVIQCIKKTDEIKNQSEYLAKLPREQNPVKDEFLEQTEYVLNHVIKITNDLRKAKQELKDQCLKVAVWTNDQNQICCDTLDSDRELKSKLLSCEQEIICYQNKMKNIQTAYDDLSLQNARLHQIVFEKGMDVHMLTKEDELKRSLKEKDDAIEILRKEKDDLQNRFSSIAGEKLREGNPAIADLRDPNRPMKIGEKYGHLYDNEWTDAMACISTVSSLFPQLQQIEIEEVVVRHLCYILQCCYKECFSLAQDQLQSIVHTMQLDVDEKCNDLSRLPVCKDVAYIRRQNCAKFSNYLFKEKVLVTKISSNEWDYSEKNDDLIRQLTETDFFQECVQLCWTMVIQDPAIHLDENLPLGTVYNKTNYKEFTESGDKVKYVVWPALFLHKDGALLFKGVVQAYK